MLVLIYQDYVHNNGLLYRSLCRHFGLDNVSFCDSDDIIAGGLGRATLFVMPGGADLYYCEKLDGEGAKAIRSYVENGGCYLGICAGGYYGSATVEWAKGQGDFEICQKRELELFPGKAIGPVYDFIENQDFSKSWHAAVPILYDDGENTIETMIFYEAGAVFVPDRNDKDIRVLARYTSLPDHPAAIVECRVGTGKAILSGPHPEITHDGLERRLHRHQNASYAWERAITEALSPYEASGRLIWARLLDRCVGGL